MDLEALLTTSQAAQLLGLYRQLIEKWRKLGHLTPAAEAPRRYRLRDILDAERATRNSPRSNR